MQTRFLQQYEGHTDSDKDKAVTYEFSGDDDVWIFIDDVLVADLGGIHDAVSVNINFATGDITISSASTFDNAWGGADSFTTYNTTLRQQFINAGQEDSASWSRNTFADNTYHTLDFFYLERGNTDSNMNLKFNLVSVPESSIIKVDQTGDEVPGATFNLYMADSTYQESGSGAIATGTTGADGQFVLMDDQGYIVSLQDLWNKMVQLNLVYPDGSESRANLILRETGKPAGYRSNAEIHLYLVESNDRVLLLSDNYWETGA